MRRTIYWSEIFREFYSSLNERTKKKIDYVLQIVKNAKTINNNFLKKIVTSSELYELRIPTDNEYRIISYAMDSDNFISSTEVLLLNGFIKKSNSDYKKHIIIARNILTKENFISDEQYKD